MIWRDVMAILGEAFSEVPDDVFLKSASRQSRCNDCILFRGKLNRFLAPNDGNPDFGPVLLHRPRPDCDVFVGPELTLIGKYLLGPGAGNDLIRFFITCSRILEGYVVNLIFTRNATCKP